MNTLSKIILPIAVRAIVGILITRVVISWFELDTDPKEKDPKEEHKARVRNKTVTT
jgi:hypothetical protein